MNILTIPYIAGGLSHFIPLYILQRKYLDKCCEVNNSFLVGDNLSRFLSIQNISSLKIDYSVEKTFLPESTAKDIRDNIVKMEKEAYDVVKPSIIIEDNAFLTPLIAEENNIPRISIQRTGIFRSIVNKNRNSKHVHSMQKGIHNDKSKFTPIWATILNDKDSDYFFWKVYAKPKTKIIPGIPSIERLPNDIENPESYFYSGPMLVSDKPSVELSSRLSNFMDINSGKPIVFITTGTIDRTPIDKFIEFFVKKNYAVITTCQCEVNNLYKENIFYNRLLPLNYICGISDLVIHQCGSGMYHYPIMRRVPSLTIGTLCYDREDVALRLNELGVSGHIPHPDDNPNYWNIFLELLNRFESGTLINYTVMDYLRSEIEETMVNFRMDKVIEYALS